MVSHFFMCSESVRAGRERGLPPAPPEGGQHHDLNTRSVGDSETGCGSAWAKIQLLPVWPASVQSRPRKLPASLSPTTSGQQGSAGRDPS